MARARRADGLPRSCVLVLVAAARCRPAAMAPASVAGRRRRLAGLDARRLRGPDGRRLGVGRVRRARQPGRRAGRPAGSRGRVRDVVRLDRDAQGDLVGIDDPRAGPAPAHRERRRDPRRRRPTRRIRAGSRRPAAPSCCGVVGGTAIDAVGWGDATNAFVEGTAAPAPPAGSSLERLPGGAAGNGIDTNDNAPDWFVQAAPSPQSLAAPPVPAPLRRHRR